jgi:UDP-glucose 4-epimerase
MKIFKDKKLLITGGTGSFGKTVLERFINSDIKEIRIFSRDEKKQNDLRLKYQNKKLKFYIGDVRSYESIIDAMHGVNYVFSAAALKQVPSCEFYPIEAVKTNILGTYNTLRAAIEKNVEKVIALSTDKAVYPINAMGMSKSLMEKVTLSLNKNERSTNTILNITRYGNVMSSRGSVIPLFVQQIKSGLPITITNPKMTRFMMSLPESVDLVLFAFKYGLQGETFVKKSPGATIITLAKALKKIFNANNEIKIIGTRHGEKKHEVLLSKEELVKAKDEGDYYRVPSDIRDLNYSQYFEDGDSEISTKKDYTSANTVQLNINEMVNMLLKLEYIQQQLNG